MAVTTHADVQLRRLGLRQVDALLATADGDGDDGLESMLAQLEAHVTGEAGRSGAETVLVVCVSAPRLRQIMWVAKPQDSVSEGR